MKAVRCFLLLLVLILALPLAAQDDTLACDKIAPPGSTAPFFIGQGDAYFAQGSYTLAIAAYSCAIERQPDYAPAYINRGFAYAYQRNDTPALADFNKAIELDQTLVAAYNDRGVMYTNEGNFGLAIDDFTLAVTLNPQYTVAFHNRAIVHAAEGNYDLALADLQTALGLEPDNPTLHASLGAVYLALAAQSYGEFRSLAGDNVPFPGSSPNSLLSSFSANTGDFSAWLTLLQPAQS